MRILIALASVLALSGCSKSGLHETAVRAGSSQELTDFRSDLGRRFPADQLATFDTALREIRLEALNKGIAPAEAREEYLRKAFHGLTVSAACLRGWQARRGRLQAEIALLSRMENDLIQQQETKGTTESNSARLQSARDVLARLQRDLAATESQLSAWDVKS